MVLKFSFYFQYKRCFFNCPPPENIVEERSSRHGPGGLPPERGGGFSRVCLRPLCYQLLMSIKSVTLINVKAMSFDSIICKNIKKKDAGLFREALKKVFFSNIS